MRIFLLLILINFTTLSAAILTVGPKGQFKDLDAAIEGSKSGDTISVLPGTYELLSKDGINFSQLKSGTSLIGQDKNKVIIKAKGDNPSFEALFKFIDKENITIKNVTLHAPQGNIFIDDCENITIENCNLTGFRWNVKRRLSIEVKEGGTFGGSSGITFKRILFNNCNPVSLGAGKKGSFIDKCLVTLLDYIYRKDIHPILENSYSITLTRLFSSAAIFRMKLYPNLISQDRRPALLETSSTSKNTLCRKILEQNSTLAL